MHALLISTYEVGHQPFGVASPAASLRAAGARVTCLDLAIECLDENAVAAADLVAFHVPMHTATLIAARLARRVRKLNPGAHLCFYGLYAPMNEAYLRDLGAGSILGGEFEPALVRLARRLGEAGSASGRDREEPAVWLGKHEFDAPDRTGLPPLDKYASLVTADGREQVTGYTEASRGCKHLCRHCPIVPVYGGKFFVVPRNVVLEDVRRQVEAGAEHVTFGDPDFFNGPGHAMEVVRALHEAHPGLTYDVTVKVEHLLRHAALLPDLAATGCLMVTTAVESLDDAVLEILDKGHTRAGFVEASRLCRESGLALNPTFVPFTPWITPAGYQDLLQGIADLGLIEAVAPIQLAIRLLIPAGSKLLELAEVRALAGSFDPGALVHPWRHPDPEMDALQLRVHEIAHDAAAESEPRRAVFERIWEEASRTPGASGRPLETPARRARSSIPYLTEPWYC